MHKFYFLILAVFALYAHGLQADILYGREIEFSNEKIWNYEGYSTDIKDKFVEYILRRCDGCRSTKTDFYDVRIHHPSGFWFEVTVDPGVIEIKTRPSTLKDLKKFRKTIQELLYDSAKEFGLKTYTDEPLMAHMHVGVISICGKDAHCFRNLMVDFMNHPELGWGMLGEDVHNAPNLMDLGKDQVRKFAEIIEEFDRKPRYSIQRLASRINDDVYDVTFGGSDFFPPEKYQAYNLRRFKENHPFTPSKRTIELRIFKVPESAEELVMQSELIEARAKYLKKMGKRKVPFRPPTKKLTAVQRVERFFVYIDECGLDWNRYQVIVDPRYRRYKPRLSFIADYFGKLRRSKLVDYVVTSLKRGALSKSEFFELMTESEVLTKKNRLRILRALINNIDESSNWVDDIPKKLFAPEIWSQNIEGQSLLRRLMAKGNRRLNRRLKQIISGTRSNLSCNDIMRSAVLPAL